MLKRLVVPMVATVLVGSLLLMPSVRGAEEAEIGKKAPSFELTDCFGKSFKLSDFKGKVVVLEWVNQFCPVSAGKHQAKTMQNTYAKYAEEGVVWLGIDSTFSLDAEKNRVYAAKMQLAFPILNDPDGKVGKAYAAKTTPHMYVVDKDGKLVYDGAIDDQRDRNYVAEAIEAVANGSTVSTPKTKPYGCSVKYKR